MNNYTYDRLDAILSLATAEYAKKLTDEFLNAKPDFDISAKTEQRIKQMFRKDKHRTSRKNAWKVIRYIMVACLIAATVAFTACMAIPRIRQAIWKAIVEWHDDYVTVKFVPNDTEADNTTTAELSDATSTDTTDKPNDPITVPPDSIVEVNAPSYMPIGYTTKSNLTDKVFRLSYYDENDSFMFSFRQTLIESGSKGDAEEGVSNETTVNGLSAVVFTYDDQPNVYNLFWQDSQYRYNIYGYFDNYNELIRFATSVEVK